MGLSSWEVPMWQLICHQTYKYRGIPVDLSGYDNHGRSIDVDFMPDGATSGSGALSFTRADSQVAISANSSWRPLVGLRVECVMRIAAYRIAPRVLVAGDGAFLFQISQAGLFASFVGPSTTPGSTTDGLGAGVGYTVPLNRWVDVAFVHDGFDTMELYADGQLLAKRTDLLAGVPGVGAAGVSIGNAATPDSQHVFDGEIDELKIWRTDPLGMWHDFILRPINQEQAACWAQFTTDLADARAKNPDCARELMLGLNGALDRVIRAILAKGPTERAHLLQLHKQYLALWRGGNIRGRPCESSSTSGSHG
jgi:Concanavalin A-like lectin/glucanases superfamily